MFKVCCDRPDNVFAFIQYKDQLNVEKKKKLNPTDNWARSMQRNFIVKPTKQSTLALNHIKFTDNYGYI